MPLFATNVVVSRAKYSGVDVGLRRAALLGFTSYDGASMAASSCEIGQLTRSTNQRTVRGK